MTEQSLTSHPAYVRLFSYLCLLFMPLAVYAPKGEVILLGLASLGLLFLVARDKKLAEVFRSPLATVLMLGPFWSGATTFWALQMRDSWDGWTSLTLLFVAIVVTWGAAQQLSGAERQQIGKWAVWGLWAALALLAIELLFDMPLARIFRSYPGGLPPTPETIFNASLGMVAAMLWPSVVWLWQAGQRLPAVFTVLAAFAVVFMGEGASAQLALVVASAVFFLIQVTGRKGLTVLAAAVTIGVLIAPILPLKVISTEQIEASYPGLKHSALHRIKIWEFAAERISEKPFIGWGLDSSRNIPGGNQIITGTETYMPLHPHNGVLQVWLELGAVGAALLAALLLICLMGLRKSGTPDRAGGTAALMGVLTILCLSFGIWQNWWVATLGLMAVLTVLQSGKRET